MEVLKEFQGKQGYFATLVERRIHKLTSVDAIVNDLMTKSLIAKREGRAAVKGFVYGYLYGRAYHE